MKKSKQKRGRMIEWANGWGESVLRSLYLNKGLKMKEPAITGGRNRECKGPETDVCLWHSGNS